MIEFLYTGDYAELEPSARLLHHVQTYTLADKCSIDPLKDEARSKLLYALGEILVIEEEDFAAATRYVYENAIPNDQFVRHYLIRTLVHKVEHFLDDKASPMCNLMAEIGEVGRDVARAARLSAVSSVQHIALWLNSVVPHCKSCESYWTIKWQETVDLWHQKPVCPECPAAMPADGEIGIGP